MSIDGGVPIYTGKNFVYTRQYKLAKKYLSNNGKVLSFTAKANLSLQRAENSEFCKELADYLDQPVPKKRTRQSKWKMRLVKNEIWELIRSRMRKIEKLPL